MLLRKDLNLFYNDLTPIRFAAMRRASGLDALDDELLERGLQNSLLTIRCEKDGLSCGMLRIVGDGAFVLVLCDMLVLPSYRGNGIGSHMMDAATEYIKALMPEDKWVTLLLTCSQEREHFYEQLGFHTMGDRLEGLAMQAFIKGTAQNIPRQNGDSDKEEPK